MERDEEDSPATANRPREASLPVRRLIVIDDDELSRELLSLIASEAGFEVECFESGDSAVASLRLSSRPGAILTDIQMPGLAGAPLAGRLRESCGASTRILAMSGSRPADEDLQPFDGFLLKPFSAEDLVQALERGGGQSLASEAGTTPILNEVVYAHFARSLPPAQVEALYTMCLGDARKRLETIRLAALASDDAAYRRAAHAIKGGCGMIGASELAHFAAEMETNGLASSLEKQEAVLQEFLAASNRLERMLENKADSSRSVVISSES